MAAENSAKGRRPIMFACATPPEHCNGKKTMEKSVVCKGHPDQAGCLACTRNYIVNKRGFTQLTSRTFSPPPDPITGELGPVLVLNKKAQRLKPGKVAGGYMAQPLKVRQSSSPGQFDQKKEAGKQD